MRQVAVAVVVCLLAVSWAAAQQSSSSKAKTSNADVAKRLDQMQRTLDAQQQRIQQLVEQVQNRDNQIGRASCRERVYHPV